VLGWGWGGRLGWAGQQGRLHRAAGEPLLSHRVSTLDATECGSGVLVPTAVVAVAAAGTCAQGRLRSVAACQPSAAVTQLPRCFTLLALSRYAQGVGAIRGALLHIYTVKVARPRCYLSRWWCPTALPTSHRDSTHDRGCR
jgi:hypothetical protein